MRIKLIFYSDFEYISIPIHYNSFVQGILYRSLPKFLSEFLHEIGFFYNGRRFKLSTFSRIFSEKYIIDKERKRIRYKNPITIYISSGVSDIAKNWGENFLKREKIKLGNNKLFLESIEILEQPEFKEEFSVKTLSPITAYRTFTNGKKFYRYYIPDEREFCELLKENLRKKYSILSGKILDDFPFYIEPERDVKKRLLKYKNFPIEAYEGIFKIKTDPEAFRLVYDTGLGSKNSQGFRIAEVV